MTDLLEPTSRPVFAAIQASFDGLTATHKRVVQAILDHPEEVIHLTVGELAERAGVAESTVVRASHNLGFKGYQDLKIRLAREADLGVSSAMQALQDSESPWETLRTVVGIQQQMLGDILSLVHEEDFSRAVDAIAAAPLLMIIGFGSSATVASEAEEKFGSIGLRVVAPPQTNRRLLAASRLGPGDVMVCVSQTGATHETIGYAEIAQRQGATVIAITNFARTRIERVADIVLTTGARDLDFRFGELSGRTTHLALLDAMYISVAMQLGEPAAAALAAYQDIESRWRL
jgi:RpiR family transcriptional regulator, carbohydrate utilization regulator